MGPCRDPVKLGNRLEQVIDLRQKTQAEIKKTQKFLEKLFAKQPESRPRESTEQLQEKVRKLQIYQETNTMSLSDEKDLLRQIKRLESQKQAVLDYQNVQSEIAEAKAYVDTLREALASQSHQIRDTRMLHQTLLTAQQLDCSLEDLQSMKVSCPASRVGRVLGKEGANINELSRQHKVQVDLVPVGKDRDIRLTGTGEALQSIVQDLRRIIDQVDRTVTVSPEWLFYMQRNRSSALAQVLERHPGVYISVPREEGSKVQARGLDTDIVSLERDIGSSSIVRQSMEFPTSLAPAILGKQGSTVTKLVKENQTLIELPQKREMTTETSTLTMVGPLVNVQAVREHIATIVVDNAEVSESVPMNSVAKSCLLLEKGKGMQELQRSVSAVTKELGSGGLSIRVGEYGLVVKGKAFLLRAALPVVEKEVSRVEGLVQNKIVHPGLISLVIGPKGATIQKLISDMPNVQIDVDRDQGKVSVCGLEEESVERALAAIELILKSCQVESVELSQFERQIIPLMRSKIATGLSKQNIEMFRGRDNKSVLLRGESLAEAVEQVKEFLSECYFEDLVVDAEGMQELLENGKHSKLNEISRSHKVSLHANREELQIEARGKQEDVELVHKELKEFCFGGDGATVEHVIFDETSAGAVIGRGGSIRKRLQEAHGVSIYIPKGESRACLRGQVEAVEACKQAILQIVATVQVTETFEVPNAKDFLRRNRGRISKMIPTINFRLNGEKLSVRGTTNDVRDAVALVKEAMGNPYQGEIALEGAELLRKLQGSQSQRFSTIEKKTKTKISVESLPRTAVRITGTYDNVCDAKSQVLSMFDFIFSSGFDRVSVPALLMPSLGGAPNLVKIEVKSGAMVRVDRDTSNFLLFANKEESIKKAKDLVNDLVKEHNSKIVVLQVDADEEYLIPTLIGKGGKQINQIRKESGCSIDVNSEDRKVSISGDDPDCVLRGKAAVELAFDTERKRRAVVEIPEDDFAAFIGRKGANVRKVSSEHKVEIKTLSGSLSGIRISGDENNVLKATEAIKAWVGGRVEAREARVSETLPLRREQVPALIGVKGSTIRSLQSEFGCQFEISRSHPVGVSIECNSQETMDAVKLKINEILNAESESADDSDGSNVSPRTTAAVLSAPKLHKNTQPRQTRAPLEISPSRPPMQKLDKSDFPSLVKTGTPTKDLNDEKTLGTDGTGSDTTAGPQWSSVVQLRNNIPSVTIEKKDLQEERRSFISMVSDDEWDDSSVGSDDDDVNFVELTGTDSSSRISAILN